MADLFLIIIIPIMLLAVLVYRDKQYKKTAYYQITNNPYSSIKYDKGKYGEYLIYKRLQHYESDGAKFLFNIYIPRTGNQTTEIDLIMISSKGLFVFESKNYSGWIFGNEIHTNWTQTFPAGRGRSHKEKFYNPIMQNASHIKHLKRLVGEDIPMRSIIVFSDACTFKDIAIKSSDVAVTKHNYVSSVVSQICNQLQGEHLSQRQISIIFTELYPYSQVNAAIREQHKNNIKNY